ncbi:putative zinc protease [Fundidesulfovibrio magnetotacticus]|uniref:Putative zinc protease n=1 Tax=Fundidesulfovibrio magnetotacticus TaxID=2730080 RepID=A0A6V8LKW0_9BACT|nr:pitrilysin family protein [Fundidesulfovibrio magnetotacticus]GFK93333.1 putative zinc protease [Fundidesulfovibrio magnetotacticus]
MTSPDDIRFHVLDNGLRLAAERLPEARSVSFGIWIEVGSRHETPDQEGAAHLWEHLGFKGAGSRSALDIAKALDLFGGHSNAFTSREHTCFHARVTTRHLEEALDILSDIALHPAPSLEDLDREKDVVLQEIAMVEDDPEESLMESFWSELWPGGALAHPILGSPETVRAFDLPGLEAWRAGHYRPERMLVAAAGGLNHDELFAMVERRFGALAPGAPLPEPPRGDYRPAVLLRERDAEQTHVTLSFPALGAADDRRFALAALNAVMGGNMSSRLFQEVRERRGLAYSVYSYANSLSDRGVLHVCAGVDPERTPELLACLREELDRLARHGVTAEELDHARDHLLSGLFLSLESSEDRMSRLARNHLVLGRAVPPEETAARFEAVTLDDVSRLARELLDFSRAGLGILGPTVDPAWREAIRP